MSKILRIFYHWCRETKGAVMVEFAVVLLVFLLIVGGIMDLGHAFYMDQVITNASREGARYGVVYQTNASGVRMAPSTYSPTIQQHLLDADKWNLKARLPSDADTKVLPGGDGYTSGNSGDPLTVQVTAVKTWFMLGSLIPGFGSSKTLSATTVMRLE